MNFFSVDFGAFVLGREILKKFPQAVLNLSVKTGDKLANQVSEQDLWKKGMEKILSQETRFGRVAIMSERKNKDAKSFYESLEIDSLVYQPKDVRRAEKKPRVSFFESQVVCEMGNEGLADSVEFRRLIRKLLRNVKSFNCDTILLADIILGEEKTKKIIQYLAGPRLKVFVPSDFLFDIVDECELGKSEQREIKISTGDDIVFTKERAEKILRTQLRGDCFI